jgi:multidrug efflux pump subunit AcrA (membrane-fusion protein)
MSAEEMLMMQQATAEAQLDLEQERLDYMLDVEQQRIDMESAEEDRLKQQAVAEQSARENLEKLALDEVDALSEVEDQEDDLLSGFGTSLMQGLAEQGARPE